MSAGRSLRTAAARLRPSSRAARAAVATAASAGEAPAQAQTGRLAQADRGRVAPDRLSVRTARHAIDT